MAGIIEMVMGFGLSAISMLALFLLGGGAIAIGIMVPKSNWKKRIKVLTAYSVVISLIWGIYTLGMGIASGQILVGIGSAILMTIVIFVVDMIGGVIAMLLNDYILIPFVKYLMKRK